MSSRITYITPSHTQVKDIIDRLKGDAFLSLNARVGDGAINTILQNLTTANRLRAVFFPILGKEVNESNIFAVFKFF